MTVDFLNDFNRVTAAFLKQALTPLRSESDGMDPYTFHPRPTGTGLLTRRVVQAVGEENHTHSPSLFSVHHLMQHGCVRREFSPREPTLFRLLLGFMLKDQHDLPAHIEISVVVILQFGRRNAEAGEHQRSLNDRIRTRGQRHVIPQHLQPNLFRSRFQSHLIFRAQGSSHADIEFLKIGLLISSRPKAIFPKELRNIVGCLLKLRSAIATSFQLIRSQVTQMLHEFVFCAGMGQSQRAEQEDNYAAETSPPGQPCAKESPHRQLL